LFDSRPPKFDQEQLCQDFFGLHVQTSAKVFDPDCLTLMDFSGIILNDGAGFHFYYVLPFTQTEALVESVFVGFSRIDVEEHRRLIKQYLAKDFGVGTFEELQTEHGCIPMQRFSSKTPSARHYFLGTKGGLVRPSTGYAFAAIHKFSNKLAGLLEDEEMPVAPATLSPKARLFDSVLLTYLKQRPHDGPLLLSSLFSFVPADVIVRFLCDRSSLQDDATIIAAMPRKYELSSIMARTCL
jgi:lycopene beta-cyclase